jgi:hypothetical protein
MAYFLSVCLPILLLAVQVLALGFLVWYTLLTKSISRAAQEQAEASQKPVVVLMCVPRSDEPDQVMERLAQKHVPQAGRLATTQGMANFIVKNIGTGPALNLSFAFAPIESKPDPDETDPHRYARRFPYLVPKDELAAPIAPANVMTDDYKFTAHYESLSGKKYLTEMVLHGRSQMTVVLRDDWIFSDQ